MVERDTKKLVEALRKISTQGLGHWDNKRKCMVDNNGDRWQHWATRASEALAEFPDAPHWEVTPGELPKSIREDD